MAQQKKESSRVAVIIGLATGRTIREIAGDLCISPKTVEYYWAEIKKSYGFRCYQDAARYAIREGLIEA